MNHLIPLLNSTLTIIAFIFLIEPAIRLNRNVSWLLIIGLLLACFNTSHGETFRYWYFGFIGELSITSYCLLFYFISCCVFRRQGELENTINYLYFFIAVFGSVFYLFALGFSPIDSYGFGFQATGLSALFGLVAVLLAWKNQKVLALTITASLAAYAGKLLASVNLWDYLFDPLLYIFCLVMCLKLMVKMIIVKVSKTDNRVKNNVPV